MKEYIMEVEMGNAPITVQLLVRCKDCKHRLLPTGETRAECMARAGWFPVDDDWFCADGERKEQRKLQASYRQVSLRKE